MPAERFRTVLEQQELQTPSDCGRFAETCASVPPQPLSGSG